MLLAWLCCPCKTGVQGPAGRQDRCVHAYCCYGKTNQTAQFQPAGCSRAESYALVALKSDAAELNMFSHPAQVRCDAPVLDDPQNGNCLGGHDIIVKHAPVTPDTWLEWGPAIITAGGRQQDIGLLLSSHCAHGQKPGLDMERLIASAMLQHCNEELQHGSFCRHF